MCMRAYTNTHTHTHPRSLAGYGPPARNSICPSPVQIIGSTLMLAYSRRGRDGGQGVGRESEIKGSGVGGKRRKRRRRSRGAQPSQTN